MKVLTRRTADHEVALNSVFLRDMPEHVALSLLESSHCQAAKAGDVLFREGTEASAVLILTEGLAKLSRTSPKGAEAVVAVVKPGESVATALAFRPSHYPVSCEVLKDCRYFAIANAQIRNLLLKSQESVAAVLSATYAHLHQLVGQVEELKSSSAHDRVASFLVMQSGQLTGRAQFKLPFDKNVIAGLLGITPETLSRTFAKLKSLGVEIEGENVRISNIAKLTGALGE